MPDLFWFVCENLTAGSLCSVNASDNQELKALLREGMLFNVRTTNSTPVHFAIAQQHRYGVAPFIESTSDMGILAGARCLVAEVAGGFSLQARLWGGQDLWGENACFFNLQECIARGNEVQRVVQTFADS